MCEFPVFSRQGLPQEGKFSHFLLCSLTGTWSPWAHKASSTQVPGTVSGTQQVPNVHLWKGLTHVCAEALLLSSWKKTDGNISRMLILALSHVQTLNRATLETVCLKGFHKETSWIKKQEWFSISMKCLQGNRGFKTLESAWKQCVYVSSFHIC